MAIDVGDGHSVDLVFDDTGENIVGIVDYHINHNDGVTDCGGFIHIAPGLWRVYSKDPLTVFPSINCTRCCSHGTIFMGEWVDEREYEEKIKDVRALVSPSGDGG